MVGLVENNRHRETRAAVSDALFTIIKCKSLFVWYLSAVISRDTFVTHE